MKDAEAAYAAEQRKVAQHISTTLPPYDADIWQKIDTAKDALQQLAVACDARENAIKACRNLIEEVGTDPPLLQLGAVPLAKLSAYQHAVRGCDGASRDRRPSLALPE